MQIRLKTFRGIKTTNAEKKYFHKSFNVSSNIRLDHIGTSCGLISSTHTHCFTETRFRRHTVSEYTEPTN